MQTKKHTHYEVMTNQIIGIVLNWLYLALVMNWLINTTGDWWAATLTTTAFFFMSYTRAYVIRRVFNKI